MATVITIVQAEDLSFTASARAPLAAVRTMRVIEWRWLLREEKSG